jgi:hypothetical protein
MRWMEYLHVLSGINHKLAHKHEVEAVADHHEMRHMHRNPTKLMAHFMQGMMRTRNEGTCRCAQGRRVRDHNANQRLRSH